MIRRACAAAAALLALALGSVAEAQPVENTPRLCQNQLDDDGDGLVDCADDGCRQLIFCIDYRPPEEGEEACGNEIDDDGDGATDCEDDGCLDICGAVTPATDGQPGTRGIYQPRVVERGPEVGYLEHDDPRDYPFGYAERPITLLEGMLAPGLGLNVFEFGGLTPDPFVNIAAGLSYGVLDFLQLTVVPVAARLSPGDAEYGSPALGMTLRFFSEEVIELGLYSNVVIPLATGAGGSPAFSADRTWTARSRHTLDTQLDVALLLRLRFADLVRIDMTLPNVLIAFIDDPLSGDLDPLVNLTFDLRLGFSITDYAYAGLSTGALLPGRDYDRALIPLGFFAGAVIPGPSRRGPLADVGLSFSWPAFLNTSPSGGADTVEPDVWQLTLDARFFLYLLP